MSIFKIIIFDVKHGIVRKLPLLFIPILLAIITFVDFYMTATWFNQSAADMEITISYVDYWFFIYGGMKEYIVSPDQPFIFPVIWNIMILLICFIVLNYSYQDMNRFGRQIIVQTGSRTLWWISKCLWTTLWVILYHAVIIVVSMFAAVLMDIPINNKVNKELICYFYRIESENFMLDGTSVPVYVLLLPILFVIVIAIIQLMLSLFIKPMFAYMLVMAICIISAYIQSPFIIGNYGMLVRLDWCSEGVPIIEGGIILVVLGIVALLMGLFRFKKYDISL